ncbi:phytanoyl-CoA dioxygenase family protein [Nonomuraea sp. FMUSA5-5]|uniref:Phytanoyl-CoA dioxygenase family protein n=1 Tax=Nonomuraea composti TaxID=2720023 RepID=A0ABX1B8E2_9ACTN|nr:phytanoyl-CoA dioxygenase family protein [Nonomuraea sp. FMUSA5-5]NJP92810.1 phytanoyl-CoA dioxygenase family protein [Nonomuraea sp. FMUSA5-5]
MTDAKLTTLPASAPIDAAIEAIEAAGAVIIEDFVDADTLNGLWEDLGPALRSQADGDGRLVGEKTRILPGLVRRSAHSVAIMRQPHFLGSARHFLQRPVRAWLGEQRIEFVPTIQLGISRAIQIQPGVRPQGLHRDDTAHLRTHPGPESRMQVMVAASAFTERNGATRVVPGSHRWDDERGPRDDEAVPAEMRPRSALLWLGSTYHGAGANRSDAPRTGLSYAYDLGNLRQEENQYLSIPLDVVRGYPEDIQRLLGYEACPPMCGLYELSDPMLLLRDASGDPVPSGKD